MKGYIFLMFLGILFHAVGEGLAQDKTAPDRKSIDPVKVGETAPDFTLSDANGRSFTLSAAKKPVVLVFYRGYW